MTPQTAHCKAQTLLAQAERIERNARFADGAAWDADMQRARALRKEAAGLRSSAGSGSTDAQAAGRAQREAEMNRIRALAAGLKASSLSPLI